MYIHGLNVNTVFAPRWVKVTANELWFHTCPAGLACKVVHEVSLHFAAFNFILQSKNMDIMKWWRLSGVLASAGYQRRQAGPTPAIHVEQSLNTYGTHLRSPGFFVHARAGENAPLQTRG